MDSCGPAKEKGKAKAVPRRPKAKAQGKDNTRAKAKDNAKANTRAKAKAKAKDNTKANTKAKAECAPPPEKPRVLLACCGSVCAAKFGRVCGHFLEWAEVKVVLTKSALPLIEGQTFPDDLLAFLDEQEWLAWKKLGDPVAHIELREWADIMVIAPLSLNTLGKIAGGLCDNLLTCIVRAWDYQKPLFVAPSMKSSEWRDSLTEDHAMAIDKLGIFLIPPVPQRTASGESEYNAMAEPVTIYSHVRACYELKMKG